MSAVYLYAGISGDPGLASVRHHSAPDIHETFADQFHKQRKNLSLNLS